MTKNKWKILLSIAAAVAVLIVLVITLANLYVDYSMANELGSKYVSVFFINLKYKVIIRIISFLLVLAAAYVSFSTVKINLLKNDEDSSYSFLKTKFVVFIPSVIIAFIISTIVQLAVYDSLLTFLHPVFMGWGDPLFFKDVGYYLFQRPFLKDLFGALFYVVLFISIAVFVSYFFLSGRMGIEKGKKLMVGKGVFFHNTLNLAVLIMIKAISYIFAKEDILFSENGLFFGADYTEHHIVGMYYNIIPWILIIVVIGVIYFMRKNKLRYMISSAALFPAAYIILFLTTICVNAFVVKPQEGTMQKEYILNNINYTRMAYGLNGVENKQFISENAGEKISENLTDIRINDLNYSLKAINQLQQEKNFYQFNDIDIARYNIGGKPSAVAISAREINKNSLKVQNQTYFNKNLKYTHGYGITAIKLNEVTSEGQPVFVAKDMPVVFAEGFKKVRQPRIYFGEMADDYAVVNRRYREFDYPDETGGEILSSYNGKAGIQMNLFNKIAYAMHYRDFQLLVSGMVDSQSRLIVNRNIIKRVETAAPFLIPDDDPYILIDDSGKLKWVIDCYTVSENYPYSQPVKFNGKRINYVRNSIKAIVDAYDGTVEFYITDKNDIVAECFDKIYPGFFNKNGLPADIGEHVVYPKELFKLKAEMLKKYHITDADVFYNNSDFLDISKEKIQNDIKSVEPYYSMAYNENSEERLLLMIPFSSSGKDDLRGLLTVDNTTNKMTLYSFASDEKLYGTMQFENRIDNDTEISSELSVISQSGAAVIRGNLLVIPVNNMLLYIEPIYVASDEKAAFPELKRIVAGYGEKLIMEKDIGSALKRLLELEITERDSGSNIFEPGLSENGNEALIELFDNVKKNLSEGDWEGFGTSFSQLEEEINRLRTSESE